jgi:CMP-N,N'-diacetyllegionaminic acid synthase
MKILALILARGGSKRLPNKNLRPLGGRPLIVWSIDVVKGLPSICNILVSTDSPSIAEISKIAGAYVPWLRPPELSSDMASSVDAALHAVNWYEKNTGAVDGLLLLQPTSPFRSRETVQRGIELFEQSAMRSIVGVAPASLHPLWALKLKNGGLVPYLSENGLTTRSQDLPPAYSVNGSFYLISPAELREGKTFFGGGALPLFERDPHEGLDIDTLEDFELAEALLLLRTQRDPKRQ